MQTSKACEKKNLLKKKGTVYPDVFQFLYFPHSCAKVLNSSKVAKKCANLRMNHRDRRIVRLDMFESYVFQSYDECPWFLASSFISKSWFQRISTDSLLERGGGQNILCFSSTVQQSYSDATFEVSAKNSIAETRLHFDVACCAGTAEKRTHLMLR